MQRIKLHQSLNTHMYVCMSVCLDLISAVLGNKMSLAWEAEIDKKRQKHKEPKLLKAVLRVFGARYAGLGLTLFLLEIGLR